VSCICQFPIVFFVICASTRHASQQSSEVDAAAAAVVVPRLYRDSDRMISTQQ